VAVVAMGGVSAWLWWQHGPDRAEQTAAPGVVQHSSPVETPGFGVPFDAPAPAPADSAAAHPADPVTVVAAPDTAGVAEPAAADAATEPAAASAPATAPAQAAPAGVTESPSPKPAPSAAIEAEKPFREGYLLIRAEPSAQVFVNGIYRGEAAPALRLTLPAGTHSIECRDERHETYAETLRIVAGETSQRNILLRQLKGIISLATTEGAEFYVDGRLVGITPITRPIEVEAGTHTLTIKKDRHYTWTSEVVVEANGTLPLRITLSPRF
jgi:hypothetical protein